MKRTFSLHLDEEAVETVKGFLEKTGQSFSGFMNGLLVEFAKEIKGQPTAFDKPVEEMTVKEFGQMLDYWFKAVKE